MCNNMKYEWCVNEINIANCINHIESKEEKNAFKLWCFDEEEGYREIYVICTKDNTGKKLLEELHKVENSGWLKAMLKLGYVKKKKTVKYVNIYKNSNDELFCGKTYCSEEKAKNNIFGDYIKTIKIEI